MASSNKRERQLARAHYQALQAKREAQAAARRRHQQIMGGVVTLVVILAGVGWFVLSRSGDQTPAAAPDTSPSTPSTPSASPSTSQSSAAGCGQPAKVTKKTLTWPSPPEDTLVAGKTYTIELDTNCGKIVIQSDPALVKAAPKTVNSQQFLATTGFFNGSDCFRLTTEGLYVLQCGSPTNDGSGGPGYQIPDENLPKDGTDNYPAGTVAMANSGPGTNGSQFFLVYKDTTLGPDYTIWGKVTSGLGVLKKVAKQGVQGGKTDGTPVQPLVITKAETSSS